MKNVYQISVFLENRAGQLAEVTGVLADNNIDMRAINIAETSDYGIVRLIVSDAQKASSILLEHGFVLTMESVEKAMNRLAEMPVEERLQLESMQPQRADIVVHGMAILLACMKKLNISEITVSEYGNLEGYLKQKYLF